MVRYCFICKVLCDRGCRGRAPPGIATMWQCRGCGRIATWWLATHSLCSLLLRTHLRSVLVATPVALHGCCSCFKLAIHVLLPGDGCDDSDDTYGLGRSTVTTVTIVTKQKLNGLFRLFTSKFLCQHCLIDI